MAVAAFTVIVVLGRYVQKYDTARLRLKDAGYLPCTTAQGTPLELCNLR